MSQNQIPNAKDIGPDLLCDPDVPGAMVSYGSSFEKWANSKNTDVWKACVHNAVLFRELVDWAVLATYLSREAGIECAEFDDIHEPSKFVDSAQPIVHKVCKEGRREGQARQVRTDIEAAEAMFTGMRVDSAKYTFTEPQLAEVQNTINALREQIGGLDAIPEQHRRRLLRRLEALQREMHEEMAALDRYMGTVLDVVVWTKRIGEEAEPVVKLAKKLWILGVAAGAAAAGLPPGALPPLLSWSSSLPESE